MPTDGRTQAVGHTDALLHTVLEAWPDLVYVKDNEHRFVLANTAAARIMGANSPEEMVGRTDFDYYPRQLAESFAATEREVLAGAQGKIDVEEFAEIAGGKQAWISSTKIPFFDADGAVCGLVGIGRDITDRKQAEQALVDQQNLLRSVLESSPLAVAITRPPEGQLVFANSRLLEIFQLSAENISKVRSTDHYGSQEERNRILERTRAKGHLDNEEVRMKRADGSEFWGRMSVRTFTFEDAPAFLAWIDDISEQRAAKEALHRSEQFFRGLVESLKDEYVFYAADADGFATYISPSVETVLGYTTDEIVGMHATALAPPDRPTNARFPEFLARTLAGELLPSYLNEVPTKDGKRRLMQTLDIPIRDSAGQVIGLQGVAHDVTEQEAKAKELRQAKERAEQSAAELRRTQAELVAAEKRASLGQLTAGVAHEIKNPLNFINNFAETSQELVEELAEAFQTVRDKLDADTRDDVADTLDTLTEDLQTIARHGHRADQIVKSMLMHARGDLAERVKTTVNQLVEEALGLAYHGERARDPTFHVTTEQELQDDLGEADLVPQEITRVLVNLFSNAFFAVRDRARSEGENYVPTVRVTTRNLGSSVAIRVWDNGLGIPAAAQAKLFTPFFTTKPTGQGTGLGLSMSHDIVVQHHGGKMYFRSEPNRFSEFVVELPRRAD